jgi:hypothetical protein
MEKFNLDSEETPTALLDHDREEWGAGPWQSEPDRVEWQDADTGYLCLAVRHDVLGHWCGLVAVPSGHPAHGPGNANVEVDVHGGLTYNGPGNDVYQHALQPPPGPLGVWWLGFDCAHAFDLVPGEHCSTSPELREIIQLVLLERQRQFGALTYRDRDFVTKECRSLAKQLADWRSRRENGDE